jgi:hypothetical protein
MENPLGTIWVRPADYRDVVRKTIFEKVRPDYSRYHRQSERETFVDEHIQKRGLLED